MLAARRRTGIILLRAGVGTWRSGRGGVARTATVGVVQGVDAGPGDQEGRACRRRKGSGMGIRGGWGGGGGGAVGTGRSRESG